MFKLLTQPFPFTIQITSRIRTAAAYGLFVFLFLYVFRPFGLDRASRSPVLVTCGLYGLVCFIVLILCFVLLPLIFKPFYAENGWTVWKEILHTLLCVTLVTAGNVLFTHYWFGAPLSRFLVWQFIWNTFSVSVFPIILLVLLRQMRLMRTYSEGAARINDKIPALSASQPPQSTFLYAQSADNYTLIFTLEAGQPVKKIIRSSLKKLEEDLRGQPGIYRCHRAYVVNLDRVIHISGNAQGYKLHVEGVEEPIPVSRNLNREITALVIRPKPLPAGPSDL